MLSKNRLQLMLKHKCTWLYIYHNSIEFFFHFQIHHLSQFMQFILTFASWLFFLFLNIIIILSHRFSVWICSYVKPSIMLQHSPWTFFSHSFHSSFYWIEMKRKKIMKTTWRINGWVLLKWFQQTYQSVHLTANDL